MTEPRKVYAYTDVLETFIPRAARNVARRYSRYGLTVLEVQQEMLLWAVGEGEKRIRKWLRSNPQQTTRIYRSLLDAGVRAGEAEKAYKCGYEPDDVQWYSPGLVESLLPLALDDTYTGEATEGAETGVRSKKPPQEGGNLLALVMDVRRALKAAPEWVEEAIFYNMDEAKDTAIQWIVDFLGGGSPYAGRRRVISNAHANAMTSQQEAG